MEGLLAQTKGNKELTAEGRRGAEKNLLRTT